MALALLAAPFAAQAAEGTRIQVTGEIIDTWCYYSGVMGSPDAVVGSAHQACALWCSAGGIPVGLLAEDGTVYMIHKGRRGHRVRRGRHFAQPRGPYSRGRWHAL